MIKNVSFLEKKKFFHAFIAVTAINVLLAATHTTANAEAALQPKKISTQSVEKNIYKNVSDANLIIQFQSINWKAKNIANNANFLERIKSSPNLIPSMLKHFQNAAEDVKFPISHFLASLNMPEIRSTAVKWANNSVDTDQQRHGFYLLSRMRSDEEILNLSVNQLYLQKDEKVLEHIVWSLHREQVPHPDLATKVVNRLNELTRHASAQVRAASIQRLADWDREKRFVEERLLALLSDTNTEVRVSAIGATSIQQQNTPEIKDRLLAIAKDQTQDAFERQAAIMNLDRFYLNKDDFFVYKNSYKDIFEGVGTNQDERKPMN